MNKLPYISICIPVYNGALYLPETMQSALSQSFQDVEVLIVDDNSTDDSAAIVSGYQRIDSRISIHRNRDRLGLVGNWNECIRRSRGTWIKFLFQDDILEPNCILKMLDSHAKSAFKEKIIFCRRNCIFETGDVDPATERSMRTRQFIWEILPKMTTITPRDCMRILTTWVGRNLFGEPSSFLIHRDVFSRIGLFDAAFHHICDLEFWLRAGVHFRMMMIPESLVRFRVHGKSATSLNRREKLLQMRYLDRVRLFRKFMLDPCYAPLREELKAWPLNMFLETQTAISARRARIEVHSADQARWRHEYSAFCLENPGIAGMAEAGFAGLAIRYAVAKCCLMMKWFLISQKTDSPGRCIA